MKPEPKPKKPTRLDTYAQTVAQDYANQHTDLVQSRRRVMQFEMGEADALIVAMQASLLRMKEKRAQLAAVIEGLSRVIEKR